MTQSARTTHVAEESLDGVQGALDLDQHGAVRAIRHSTHEPAAPRGLAYPGSIVHSLHSPVRETVPVDHRAHAHSRAGSDRDDSAWIADPVRTEAGLRVTAKWADERRRPGEVTPVSDPRARSVTSDRHAGRALQDCVRGSLSRRETMSRWIPSSSRMASPASSGSDREESREDGRSNELAGPSSQGAGSGSAG